MIYGAEPLSPPEAEGPAEDETLRARLRTIALWLAALGLAVLLLTLSLASAHIRSQVAGLEAELVPLRATLAAASTPRAEVAELTGTLAAAESIAGKIRAMEPTVQAAGLDWAGLIRAIGGYDPGQLTLTSLVQNGSEITLKGTASSEGEVAAYARMLDSSGLFERVSIQSMKTSTAPFVPAEGSPSATPASHTPTPTPEPGDAFEPDVPEARDIFLGQAQLHTFWPAGDVDQVRFMAKAGRFYRVFTSDLVPGVDTLLTVTMCEATFTNDDSRPGTLSSEVSFQVGEADVYVVAEIRNRGSDGPKMSYRVTAEEVVPTPTRAPRATATPRPTNTIAPTATLTPTPTATATATVAGSALSGVRTPLLRTVGLASYVGSQQPATSVEFVIVLVVKAAQPWRAM